MELASKAPAPAGRGWVGSLLLCTQPLPGRPANPDPGRAEEGPCGQGCGEGSPSHMVSAARTLEHKHFGGSHASEASQQLRHFQIVSLVARSEQGGGAWVIRKDDPGAPGAWQ